MRHKWPFKAAEPLLVSIYQKTKPSQPRASESPRKRPKQPNTEYMVTNSQKIAQTTEQGGVSITPPTQLTLGDRMKGYENLHRHVLPKRQFYVLRVDGRAFHTYTRSFQKPFDHLITAAMTQTAIKLCNEVQGAIMGYVQSDEISIVFTDLANEDTQAWFAGNLNKIVSISAAIATLEFNRIIEKLAYDAQVNIPADAYFDSRVFVLPSSVEVENYLIWRQRDAVRNAIAGVAQAMFSHKELHKKSTTDMLEMITKKGVSFEECFSTRERRGGFFYKTPVKISEDETHYVWSFKKYTDIKDGSSLNGIDSEESYPDFIKDRHILTECMSVLSENQTKFTS